MSIIYIAHISDLTQPITENMLSKLTPQRKARMCRYRQHSDKLRCVAAALLARLGAQEFFSDTNVQVFMPAGMPPYAVSGNKVCRMSISHTADRVMCMTDSEDCGVDIESEHACREAVGLAERHGYARLKPKPYAPNVSHASGRLRKHILNTVPQVCGGDLILSA